MVGTRVRDRRPQWGQGKGKWGEGGRGEQGR